MRIKIGLFGLFIVASLGLPVQAASIDVNYATQVVNIGTPVDIIGFIGPTASPWVSNDWLLDIQPSGVNASTLVLNTSIASTVNFQLFECSTDCLGPAYNGWTAISGAVQSLTATMLGTNEYFLRMGGGGIREGFVVRVSAVPLPAAALLFLSGLAGFGLLSRGKKESTDTDMPLLAA